MKRTSYLAELECKLCIGLNCKNAYPTYENSSFFNLVLEYIENFFDKADVVIDILPYLRLMQPDDANALREKLKNRIEAIEAGNSLSHGGAAAGSQPNPSDKVNVSNKLPDLKVIRWKMILFKLSKIVGHFDKIVDR
jgi:hypothetical protein